MSARQQQMLLGAGAGYQISRSLRFRRTNTAYVTYTPSVGNRNKWTFSSWVKRSGLTGGPFTLLAANGTHNDTDYVEIAFNATDNLRVSGWTTAFRTSNSVYRDPSAWMHVVVAVDTSLAAASKILAWVNGVAVTWTGTTNPAGTGNLGLQAAVAHYIGSDVNTVSNQFDGYMADTYIIDNQYLDPTYFGQTDATTNTWNPKAFSGAFSALDRYYKWSDNSNTTAATLGADSSGNGLNATPTNMSITAGATNDSLTDSPTNYGADTGVGGEVRGNYTTLNPLVPTVGTISNGNLDFTYNNAGNESVAAGGFEMSSGKWYFESTVNAVGTTYAIVGLTTDPMSGRTSALGAVATQYGYLSANGNKFNNGSSVAYGATFTTADVIGVALDLTAGTLVFYKNGVSQGTAYTGLSGTFYPAVNGRGGSIVSMNFGQRPFANTAPAGYKTLCTQNFSALTITKPALYFDVNTRTGTGAAVNITGKSFQPDLVWIKSRTTAGNNLVFDSVRGATKYIITNTAAAEGTAAQTLTSFNSDGFSFGTDTDGNASAASIVDWMWKGGGAAVTNNNGSISSQVSVSATSGVSVGTFTGTGSNATVGHGLGVAPKMVLTKARATSIDGYGVYHSGMTSATFYMDLHTTAGQASAATVWNSTAPTTTVFSTGTSTLHPASSVGFIAFAEIVGFSKFGSYVGNAGTDGTFVYCGFRPRWIMLKEISTTGNWQVIDTARDPSNAAINGLQPNLSNAESSPYNTDFLSNGFKLRTTTAPNAAATYIFAAFAEAPFTYARAR